MCFCKMSHSIDRSNLSFCFVLWSCLVSCQSAKQATRLLFFFCSTLQQEFESMSQAYPSMVATIVAPSTRNIFGGTLNQVKLSPGYQPG
mmetsp:Transcript_23492/g.42363  ORF Transcript_23492/g.42363 Transcript_23492/m.42363 type:complete len:89 (-) Transcript_23492:1293-1559(-)